MKKKHSALALLLAAAMLLPTLASCSSDGGSDDTTADDTTVTTEETTAPEADPDAPVIIRYDGSEAAKSNIFVSADGSLDGKYSFTEVDGETVLKLDYSKRAGFNSYRVTPIVADKRAVTKEHKFICVVYKTNDTTLNSLLLTGNNGMESVPLVQNTMYSAGEWSVSAPIDVSEQGYTSRFADSKYFGIEFTSDDPACEFYIKEIAFFTSIDDALSHYDGVYASEELPINAITMTFGDGGNSIVSQGEKLGNNNVNSELGTLELNYAEETVNGNNYLARLTFNAANIVDPTHFYARILYSADIADGSNKAKVMLYDDKAGSAIIFASDLVDTNGNYVLTDTAFISYDAMERFQGGGDYRSPATNTLAISDGAEGNSYSIKAIYFFNNRDDARRFTYAGDDSQVLVNGTGIENYRIVIAEDPAVGTVKAASVLRNRIRDITGVLLDIVYDSQPESEYEILVGRSSRAASHHKLDVLEKNVQGYYSSLYALVDNDIVITSILPTSLPTITNTFINDYLYGGLANTPDTLRIDGDIYKEGYEITVKQSYKWVEPENVAEPEVLTFDFAADDGYFTEEAGAEDFVIAGGRMTTQAKDNALTYIHVYEKNAEISADFRLDVSNSSSLFPDSEYGLMLRYTAEHAYIKGGYDAVNGEWFIDSREGIDFYKLRTAVKAEAPEPGVTHKLTLKADGDKATLYLNGTEVLTAKVSQLTPGRVGIFADGTALSVDNAVVTLLSGQGTPLRYVEHTKLPNNTYFEGGTVYILDDGTYHYRHHSGITYESADNGQTWQAVEQKFTMTGYSNMLRLNNGSWLKMVTKDGWWISQISEDGESWIDGGRICQTKYMGSTDAGAGNMNDKISQSGTTDRIFYCQNYETTKEPVDGRMVFCEFYYSDDNGMSWTKSDTDSWELPGNEKEAYFGECKILECADGTLRMYNSWNKHECIVYSESTDYGVTWGPLVHMEEFVCPQSSMQFVRDSYGETDTTYYMVWVYGPINGTNAGMNRSRLSLAKTTDGKNWEFLGDIWRWENNWYAPGSSALITHIVDPFIQVTEDYIICGSGFSEQIFDGSGVNYHQSQRQHLYSIRKDTLEVRELPPVE